MAVCNFYRAQPVVEAAFGLVRRCPRISSLGVFILVFLAGAGALRAQGTVSVLETGGGEPLVSDQVVLQTDGQLLAVVQFDFGFVTDQIPSPGTFLDSITVSIQDAAGNLGVISTTDASGTVWEPSSPGAATLSPSAVQFQSISPTGVSPINGAGVAYQVDFTPGPQFSGTAFTLDFDLFDNMDSSTYADAWFGNVEVVSVPEPSSLVLACLPAVFYALKRKPRP